MPKGILVIYLLHKKEIYRDHDAKMIPTKQSGISFRDVETNLLPHEKDNTFFVDSLRYQLPALVFVHISRIN